MMITRNAMPSVSVQTALQRKKFPPRLGQLRCLDFTRDPPLEFRMKNRACTVNHDHIFCAFSANGVRHTRWNHDADVVVAPVVIAIDKETHHAPGKARSDVAQDYLNSSLQKEHHIPLLIIVATQRIILWRAREQTPQPFLRGRIGWNTRWVHMKPFGAVCKHARSRPLLRPKSDLRQNSIVTSDKFTENSAMTLRMDCARENFHARDPGFLDLPLAAVRRHKFAGIHTSSRKFLCERCGAIVTRPKRILSAGFDALPKIFFALAHF